MRNTIILASLSILLITGCGSKTEEPRAATGRSKAASFVLEDLDGREFSLDSAAGSVLVLDFWATWCAPCRKAIPELISLYNEYEQEDLLLWGIGIDKPDALRSFAESFKIPYPVLVGSRATQAAYRVTAIPTVFLIDREGRIAGRFQGYRPGATENLKAEITKLLKE